MHATIRRQFDFSLAGAIAWAMLVALVIVLAAAAITAPVMGCQAAPTNETKGAILRTQKAQDAAGDHLDRAIGSADRVERGIGRMREIHNAKARQ